MADSHGARGARLLLADDNKVNRLLLARNLELQGHRVTTAENGRIALDLLRREAFDLLLLDMEMPELDGFGVLEQLVADGGLRDLPVIVTSSLEGVAHVARCIELGGLGGAVGGLEALQQEYDAVAQDLQERIHG